MSRRLVLSTLRESLILSSAGVDRLLIRTSIVPALPTPSPMLPRLSDQRLQDLALLFGRAYSDSATLSNASHGISPLVTM
jgi:hypothetical protein